MTSEAKRQFFSKKAMKRTLYIFGVSLFITAAHFFRLSYANKWEMELTYSLHLMGFSVILLFLNLVLPEEKKDASGL